MICDNCGAIIDAKEEFCPNCGMQLLDPHPKPKYNKNSGSSSRDSFKSVDKPIKQRYIEDSRPESYDYTHYFDDEEYVEYESADQYYAEDYEGNPGIGIGNIIIFLFIALILGFIAGLLMFSSQSIPQIPGINS